MYETGIQGTSTTVSGLTAGKDYDVMVRARNEVGLSEGAMVTVKTLPFDPTANQPPSKPLNLILDSSPSGNLLSWTKPVKNGGQPIIDYRIWSDQGSSGKSFVKIAEGVIGTNYQLTGLIDRVVYQFKVEARNSIGYSPFSDIYQMTSLWKPDKPEKPQTKFTGDYVEIMWTEPNDGGKPITGYLVLIR